MNDEDVYSMAVNIGDRERGDSLRSTNSSTRSSRSSSTNPFSRTNLFRSPSFNLPPKPFYAGPVERATGAKNTPLWKQDWTKRFIEVRDAELHIFPSKQERHEQGTPIHLEEVWLYLQGRHITLELVGANERRIFRLPNDDLAWRLYMILSRFCQVPPFAEGFCQKLSGGHGRFEDRMLRISSEGILEWLKPGESTVKGAIQVRGEGVNMDYQETNKVLIITKSRIYEFKFFSKEEADHWYQILSWHSTRPKLDFTSSKNLRA